MYRDFNKLEAEYEKKFFNAPPNSKRGKLYISDYIQIKIIALKEGEYSKILFRSIDIALKAGVMIGYRARKAEEREARRKQKGNL